MDAEKRYRPGPKCFWAAILCVIGFCFIDVVSVVGSLWNLDGSMGRPLLAALLFGLFWTTWLSLSVKMLFFAMRYVLIVSPDKISQAGVFRTERMHFDELITARWRRWPQGGSLVLRSSVERIVVEFAQFTAEERAELIEGLRALIKAEKQVDWEKFSRSTSDDPATRERKNRVLRFLLPSAFLFFAALFAFEAVSWGRNDLYFLAVLNIAAAAWTVFALRPSASRKAKKSPTA